MTPSAFWELVARVLTGKFKTWLHRRLDQEGVRSIEVEATTILRELAEKHAAQFVGWRVAIQAEPAEGLIALLAVSDQEEVFTFEALMAPPPVTNVDAGREFVLLLAGAKALAFEHARVSAILRAAKEK